MSGAPKPGPDRHGGLFVAVDIGASSGRVMLGRVGEGVVSLETVHRFPNAVLELDGALRWALNRLFAEVLTGLTAAAGIATAQAERITSIGIDTWAVDYGLINADGSLKEQPHSYRDDRSLAAVDRVHSAVPPEHLYGVTGLQFLPFNTIYQLAAEPTLDAVQALLIPDLLAFWLTGQRRTEVTNASTTGLLDARSGQWADALLERLRLPLDLFPPLIQPGERIGTLLPEIAQRTGLAADTAVVAVGSHDTASAVAAVPALSSPASSASEPQDHDGFAYISSGTWSLVGVELAAPVLTEASRAANFTNERGVDGTIRYLRNVGGLWLLSECLRSWAESGEHPDLQALLDAAAGRPAGGPQINPDDAGFIAPDGMPERIRAAVSAAGAPQGSGGGLGADPVGIVRCILDSLAAAYARTVAQLEELSGKRTSVVHIVGGGSQNALLCQLTATATGKPVIAGPVEATALGNVLLQARAAGVLCGGLPELRALVAASVELRRYEPSVL
ncbi:rhamnulokinase [Psychromicrobium xiongbiense]|uniref:rhamnulokinase n=1 Tax=Psychromicrobium xiongbiense TaxID=3051184 RepID=UPI002554A12E|nr:rhamnulokinase family protein [Psychromicrobium sp. YIM S02556]